MAARAVEVCSVLVRARVVRLSPTILRDGAANPHLEGCSFPLIFTTFSIISKAFLPSYFQNFPTLDNFYLFTPGPDRLAQPLHAARVVLG